MAIRRGNIVLAVHADLGKPRPAVVVQADIFNESAGTILVCPLTSDITERMPLRPILQAAADTELRERSQIMTERMMALRVDRIRGVLGSIDTTTAEQLDRALLIILGLGR
jgi:mRNA interferase MazF